MDEVVRDLRDNGVTEAELERAKKQFIAEFVYESDSQQTLARRYGAGMALGLSVAQIDSWPAEIAKVTLADVKRVAQKYLDVRHSVTGTLIPVAAAAEPAPASAKKN
jgi:zinc protease